ncbi:hypothetical protein JRQ81_011504 [Phrynocephalus forsythii]|uniref:Immunoglobulin V-set domain-containing protein n=1 Tax=Phrynocephalus forsythii TaxID=171643 RepID=A0A9Q1AQ84_9SAUR|nr:hypothetical protein JRQ81_011504 [Phrynocephalus forsythii]
MVMGWIQLVLPGSGYPAGHRQLPKPFSFQECQRGFSRISPTAGACFRFRGGWPMLLLAGHLWSSFCFTSTEGTQNFSILVTAEPWFPIVGTDVNLIPEDQMENVLTCTWYRWDLSIKNQILVYELPPSSKVEHKNSYTGREIVKTDCSLHINNVSLQDGGYYMIQKNTTGASEAGQIFLVVIEGTMQPKRPKGLSGVAVAGIFILGVVLITAVIFLVSYKILSNSMGEESDSSISLAS